MCLDASPLEIVWESQAPQVCSAYATEAPYILKERLTFRALEDTQVPVLRFAQRLVRGLPARVVSLDRLNVIA